MLVLYCLFGRLVGRLVALPCFDICCASCFDRAFIIVALVCFVLSCYGLYCLPTFASLFYALLALVWLCLVPITCFPLSPCSSPLPPPPPPQPPYHPQGGLIGTHASCIYCRCVICTHITLVLIVNMTCVCAIYVQLANIHMT